MNELVAPMSRLIRLAGRPNVARSLRATNARPCRHDPQGQLAPAPMMNPNWGSRLRQPGVVQLNLVFGLWLCLLLIGQPRTAHAADMRCVVCQERIAGQFYWVSSPAMAVEKQSVCETCFKLENHCSICKLPINHQGRKLSDGRYLCPADFSAAVFDEREAARLYEETRRELQAILAGHGTIPTGNIKVMLVDGNRLKQLNQTLPSAHDDTKLLGLTRSRIRNKLEFEHDIYLINGLGQARLAAVAAHEFTHAWIHENVPTTRQLEHDSVEGFCELVAYKVMSRRAEETEKKVILANAYTRGQVNAFVQAENTHQFHRVVKWMKTGIDDNLIMTNGSQVLSVREEPAAPVWPPPAQRITSVPNRLELRGISGAPGRRFALVNNCTMAKGDPARVRVGRTNVNVQCLEVREASVVLQLEGQSRSLELFLRSPAAHPARLAGDVDR